MIKVHAAAFFICLAILMVFSSTVSAQSSQNLKVGDYAKYTIPAAHLIFANNSIINTDANQESTLTWKIKDISDSNFTIKLDLHVPILDSAPKDFTATITVIDGSAYFVNGTKWGYLPFWINTDSKLNDIVNISGKDTLLVTGNVTNDSKLKEVSSGGWQDCYEVKSNAFEIFNITMRSTEYTYDKDSGILVTIGFMKDPIALVFGDFIISGGLILSNTNVDFGPQSNLTILVYLAQYWPIILLIAVFVVSLFVYQRVTRRSKARRKD